MIELLTANTPNGKKISIMLEEINYKIPIMVSGTVTDGAEDYCLVKLLRLFGILFDM